jgi:hypothetical protein
MILGVPISLIAIYALYRMDEYYMLLWFRRAQAAPINYPLRGRMAVTFFLFPARVFGWVFLLYFGWRNGWIKPVVLIAVAFPLSLLMQIAPVRLLRGRYYNDLIALMTLLGFVVLPACAVLMFVLLPAR